MKTPIGIIQSISAFILSLLLALVLGWLGEATRLPAMNSWSLTYGMIFSIWSFLFIVFFYVLRYPFDVWRRKDFGETYTSKQSYPIVAICALLFSIVALQPWPLFWFYELYWLFKLEFSYPILEVGSLFYASWALFRYSRKKLFGGREFSLVALIISIFTCYNWIVRWVALSSIQR